MATNFAVDLENYENYRQPAEPLSLDQLEGLLYIIGVEARRGQHGRQVAQLMKGKATRLVEASE